MSPLSGNADANAVAALSGAGAELQDPAVVTVRQWRGWRREANGTSARIDGNPR